MYDALEEKLEKAAGGEGAPYAFPNLPQGGCTCNLGPKTVTPMHRDSENLSYGLCVVSAFGDFDWQHGGELMLFEPKVIVQMRPGDSLIFPSAAITHGNLPLSSKPGQTRYSLTHYTAGSLFQWVANDCRLVKNTKRPANADWKGSWDHYSTWEELNLKMSADPNSNHLVS